MAQLIYLADDEKDTLDMLAAFLEQEGYSVQAFLDGESLLSACDQALPDLVVLDIMMPGMDGLSVCSSLLAKSKSLPIIIISARVSSFDRVAGLSLGSDDYIIKPFLPLELSIRARALLRRAQPIPTEEVPEITFGPLVLNPSQRTARLEGKPFSLSPTEFDFLVYLIEHKGTAVSRESLLQALWHVSWEADTRVADDLVKRLRRKFREAKSPIRIETVWGYGFRISLEEKA